MPTTSAVLSPLLVVLLSARAPATAGAAAGGSRPPTPIGAPFRLNVCTDCEPSEPRLVRSADGHLLAAWTQGIEPPFEAVVRPFAADLTGGAEVQLGAAGRDTRLAGVGVDPGGGFVAGWQEPLEIWFQKLAVDGTGVGLPVRANIQPSFQREETDAALSVAADGALLLTWDRLGSDGGSLTDVVAQVEGPDGRPLGDTVTLGSGTQTASPQGCLRPDRSVAAVWMSSTSQPPAAPVVTGLEVGLFGADLVPLAPARQLLAGAVAAPTLRHTISCASDGSFAVAWHTDRPPARRGFDIVLQRFDAAGRPLGATIVVNAAQNGDQLSPTLLRDAGGRLLVAWAGPVGRSAQLRGRWLGSNGKPAGGELILRKAVPGMSLGAPFLSPTVTNGRFTLAWEEGGRIYGQLFQP